MPMWAASKYKGRDSAETAFPPTPALLVQADRRTLASRAPYPHRAAAIDRKPLNTPVDLRHTVDAAFSEIAPRRMCSARGRRVHIALGRIIKVFRMSVHGQ